MKLNEASLMEPSISPKVSGSRLVRRAMLERPTGARLLLIHALQRIVREYHQTEGDSIPGEGGEVMIRHVVQQESNRYTRA